MGKISRKFIHSLVVVALLAGGCDAKRSEKSSTQSVVMKTHCIGRSLIDLPEGYALVGGALGIFVPDQTEVEDASIDLIISPDTSAADFERTISARHAKLASSGSDMRNKLVLVKKIEGGEIAP